MKSQSFFDAELPSDPTGTYRYERHKSDYYDPEDIGLAYENADDIVFGVEADDEINYSDDDLGIEPPHFDDEDEIGLGIPLPDIEVLGGLTPAPQDPVSNDNDDYGLSMKIPFIEFAKEIVYTLASKVTGYCNLHELKEDLRKDTGLLPDYVVSHYGYPSFETFMTSDDMKRHVTVHLIDGKHYFLPKHCEKFAHIRNEQEIERAATMLNQNREENEKLCRALLPENRETTIKGRQLISELIYELGGEQKPVLWQDVQKKYKEKFNEELAGEALKKMFQRDKAIKIIETIFHKEIELYAANLPGQFFLKFRMPYKDIVAFYEEQLKEHSEAKTKFKSASEKFLRPRTNYKQNKVFPLCPMYPPLINNVSPPDDKNVPFGGITNNCERNEGCSSNQQQNISINNDNSVQKKSKFDISLDELGLCNTKKQTSFTEMLQNEDDVIAEENRIKIKYNRNGWTEEETNNLPAYEIINNTGEGNSKTSRLDCPVENVVKNGSGEVNKAVNNKTTSTKKIRYTARFAGQDFTDSEEESDDDDEENNNKIKQKEREKEGGGTKITAATPTPIELTKQSENEKEILTSFLTQKESTTTTTTCHNINNNIFVPSKRTSGHRAGIENFMKEKIEQRKKDESSIIQQDVQQQQATSSTNIPNLFETPSSPLLFPQIPQQPSNFPKFLSSNDSINEQKQQQINNNNNSLIINSTKLPTITTTDIWLLIDKVEWLRNLANKQKMSHESRPDEGSFIFRKGNEVLVLTESDDKIRASKHCEGKIKWDRYFPKVFFYYFIKFNLIKKTDWEMFSITIYGLVGIKLCDIPKMEGNKKMIELTPVPDIYKTLSPPFPAFRKTTCGQAFLCFFTKQYGFSNHYLVDFEIDGVTYCCSEQYYMFKKASRFGFFGVANEIMHTKDTTMIKYLGNANTMRERQANGSELNSRFFDHDEWRKVKGKIMYTALYAKFEQNVQLFNMLIATENAKLIEASPSDLFWGIGCGIDSEEILRIDKWRGSNYLGVLLMRLRKEFQARFKLNVDEFDDCF